MLSTVCYTMTNLMGRACCRCHSPKDFKCFCDICHVFEACVPVWVPALGACSLWVLGNPSSILIKDCLGPAPWKASMARCLFDLVGGRLEPVEKLVGIFPRHYEIRQGCLEQVLSAQVAFTASPGLDSSARQSVCLLNPGPSSQLKPGMILWREFEWVSVPPGARAPTGREVRARTDPPPSMSLLCHGPCTPQQVTASGNLFFFFFPPNACLLV